MSVLADLMAQYQRLVVRFAKLYERYQSLQREHLQLHEKNDALHEKNAKQRTQIETLSAELRRLKRLPKRPAIKPSGMHESSGEKVAKESGKGAKKKRTRKAKRYSPKAVEKTVVVEHPEVPEGSVRNGYQTYTVQNVIIQPEVVHYKRARWLTPAGQTLTAPLPAAVQGHYSGEVRRLAVMLYCQGQSTFERVTASLNAFGITISKRTVVRLVNEQPQLLEEADEVLQAGLDGASWVNVDDTGARHRAKNGYCTVVGNDRFTYFATRQTKSRLSFLGILNGTDTRLMLNGAAFEYMRLNKLAAATIGLLAEHPSVEFNTHAEWTRHLEVLGISALQVTPDPVKIATEAALWGALTEYRGLTDTVVLSDDAGQFRVGTHALCWVHAERLVHKLLCPSDRLGAVRDEKQAEIWDLYTELQRYKQSPSEAQRTHLSEQFDRIFNGDRTEYATLNGLLERLNGKKDQLLTVLDYPATPLHTNLAENDIRAQVTRRKISAGTRSESGRETRDACLGLLKTCNKVGVPFWDYLGSRLLVPDAPAVPRLATLVSQTCGPP